MSLPHQPSSAMSLLPIILVYLAFIITKDKHHASSSHPPPNSTLHDQLDFVELKRQVEQIVKRLKAMGKQTIMEEKFVKLHLGSSHYVESVPAAIYTPVAQNASHRGSNVATKQVRFNHVSNMPLHFEERTHIGYDDHVLDVTPNTHFRQDPHFDHYDHHGRAFDRNYRQLDPHGRLFNRDHRQSLRYANNEHVDITRKVKLNAPKYDGKLDPDTFIDCLDGIEEYCDFYHMIDLERVCFAKIKLT
ncbi:hypothetical protein GH714_034481 [Hevea brasiliensis]|uniref:Uncharacterized protein n=1 Tax=Hevea brasiliensis TaxID=3981 RepID=A0A6A6LQ11_HEVBR|nr:hypothetical protein GH714_034481 [Hevea brasiliensis]